LKERCWFDTDQLRRLLKQRHHAWLSQLVKDIAAIPVRANQVGFTQRHQVLGNAGLTHAENHLQVTNAGFLFTNDEQDLNAHRLADQGQQPGNILDGKFR